ncbi:hypothetical protein QTQ03_20780 [Micromonospora sp. WMMA1363]|uniref:hypothetical protein n=1 Tax=Micromonospora sp. WMMA1363 TaxID=3053985 RepID=UPI00259CBE17|nr:hypothetical protein [Micromonospora sp. WMMA1363]MDM4721915.1 hypothetical protein [Micromonospora sp. WMMA1363]
MTPARCPPAVEVQPVRKAVDVSTHRRAWKQRAGVVVALVVGALLTVPAAPALAAEPGVLITGLSSGTLTSGQQATLSFRVTNNNAKQDTENSDSVDVRVTTTFGELRCDGNCAFTEEEIDRDGGSKTYKVTLVAGNVAAGGTKSGKVQITAAIAGESGNAERDITVRGPQPQQPETVRSISGKVVNRATGDAVSSAVVILQDASGKKFDTVSDDNGNYRFTGTTSKPIAPGRLDIGASFDNIYATKSFNASNGQSITGQRITLAIKTEVTPSATPSESVEATPSAEVTEEGTEETSEAAAAPPPANAGNESSGGTGSLLIILLGGLLVAAGVGTIVLLWMRRKQNDDDAIEGGPAPAVGAAGAVPAARGAYHGVDDQTRVVNPAGTTPTMVGGGLNDAPTMLQRPMVDDVPPDPYGAPPQPYGAPAGWGDGGYGTAPSSDGGYGGSSYSAPAGAAVGAGYPPAPGGAAPSYGDRYDEPTGRYQGDATQYPEPADPYATGTYRQETGYGQPDPAPYGRGGEPTGGYGQGGYDQGGYDQRGGYGSYDQPGGYGQEPPAQRGGYDDRGYDQGGYGDPAQTGRGRPDGPPHDRSGRRLDWLDD